MGKQTAATSAAPFTAEELELLAPILAADGTVDPAAVQRLFDRHPSTLTKAEALAIRVPVFFQAEFAVPHGLAGCSYTSEWMDAFMAVVGGRQVREKVRHGEVVERTETRHPGRDDIREHYVRPRSVATRTPRAARRESHRTRPGHRRASSSSTTSSADPGSDSDPDPARRCAAPWCSHPVYGRKAYCGTESCNQARATERQRKHRHGAQTSEELERAADALLANYIGRKAFAAPDEHSLSFLWRHGLAPGTDPGEFEAICWFRRGLSGGVA